MRGEGHEGHAAGVAEEAAELRLEVIEDGGRLNIATLGASTPGTRAAPRAPGAAAPAAGAAAVIAQVRIKDGVIHISFPNLDEGGYFVNGIEGRTHHGQTGFFTLNKPAKVGKTLLLEYGD